MQIITSSFFFFGRTQNERQTQFNPNHTVLFQYSVEEREKELFRKISL